MDYREKYQEWLTKECFDEATKEELRGIGDNEEEIRDRFYTELEFGTAGLRGVIGAGLNRMNYYTVGRATQGLADYINALGATEKGVAIAFDSRHMSPEFADASARVLAANGIPAYVFESLRPTPELSFAVRYLNCTAGINITASHNPPEYNGYKVYWADGAQITPPHDSGITACVAALGDFSLIRSISREEALAAGLYRVIGKEVDDAYISEVKKQVKHPEAIASEGKNLKIVYTPLHGTGLMPVTRVLAELGFENVYVVPEQAEPDGSFPTVSYPNPEDKKAFALALSLAAEKDADLVLATDPDADRLGVYVKDREGDYQVLTGNMSGCLLAEYTISQIRDLSGIPEGGALIKSVVSSNLADAIARFYGVELIETLTGFKYIGGEILRMEQEGKGSYLFGFEESYGCLIGTYARDKDAVVATMALCEAAAFYKSQGKNLWDVMLEMYDRYGYYREDVVSVTMKGADGIAKIGQIMERLRSALPSEVGGKPVLRIRDFLTDRSLELATGENGTTGFPKSNVLYFDFANGEWLCVRPSGTEPKIKLYIGVTGASFEDSEARAKAFMEEAQKLLEDPAEAGGPSASIPSGGAQETEKAGSPVNFNEGAFVYGPAGQNGAPRYRFAVPAGSSDVIPEEEKFDSGDGFTALGRIFAHPASVIRERMNSKSGAFAFFAVLLLALVKYLNGFVIWGVSALKGYRFSWLEPILLLPENLAVILIWTFTHTLCNKLFMRLIGKKKLTWRSSFTAAACYILPYVPYYFLVTFTALGSGVLSTLLTGLLSTATYILCAVFGYTALKEVTEKKDRALWILVLAAGISAVCTKTVSLI